jgi:hypothetical protein
LNKKPRNWPISCAYQLKFFEQKDWAEERTLSQQKEKKRILFCFCGLLCVSKSM